MALDGRPATLDLYSPAMRLGQTLPNHQVVDSDAVHLGSDTVFITRNDGFITPRSLTQRLRSEIL